MSQFEQDINRFENKMKACSTMTDLLVAMSSWQSFCESHALTKEEMSKVNQAYVKAEGELITKVKPSLW